MTHKDLIKQLEDDGWYLYRTGKHRIYRHPIKKNQLTLPFHSGEVATGTARRILKDAGLL